MYFRKLFLNAVFLIKNFYKIVSLHTEKEIAELLIKNSIKISSAESCTGGLISSRLTDISGSSAYVFQNFVTYSNAAKQRLLDVNPETIEEYGAVSDKTALEMVRGLLKKYDCNIAVSTTGIAGPSGGNGAKPVGLVYIGIGNNNIQKVCKYEANPMYYRIIMKYAFMLKTFDLLLEFLKENY